MLDGNSENASTKASFKEHPPILVIHVISIEIENELVKLSLKTDPSSISILVDALRVSLSARKAKKNRQV